MEKNSQFPILNENTSRDQLFDFSKRGESLIKKSNQHKPLIEKLMNKLSPLNRSILSNNLNNSNTSNKINEKEKNINVQENKKNNYLNINIEKENKRKSSTSTKKGRKSSLMNYIEKNPLAFIESLKKLEEHKSKYGRTLLQMKYCDITIGLLSIISMLFALIDNELYSSNSLKYINDKNEKIGKKIWTIELLKTLEKREISKNENFFRVLNIITSVLSCMILIIKYYYHIIIYKIDKKISEYDGLFSSGLYKWLLLECIISLIFFPPNLNIVYVHLRINIVCVYSLNTIFLPFNGLKLYNVFRLIMLLSRYNTRISQTICQSHKTVSGIIFVIKSEINNKKLTIITFTVLFLCIFVTAIIRDFECLSFDKDNFLEGKKGLNDLQNYMNNLWLILITLTNVGFGDEYPRTIFGRIFIFFVSFLGLLGLGIVIATLSEKLEFTQNEKKAYLKLKKIFDPENLEHKAANTIKTILQMRRNIKLKKGSVGERRSIYLKEKIVLLLKIRAETRCYGNELHVSRVYSMPMNDLVKTLETKLYDNLVDISKDLESINVIENDFESLRQNQIYIQKKLKRINFLQTEIGKYLLEQQNNNYLNKDKYSNTSEKVIKNERTFNGLNENESKKKMKKKPIKSITKQRSLKNYEVGKLKNLSKYNNIEVYISPKKIKKFNIKMNENNKENESPIFLKKINIKPRKINSSKYLNKIILPYDKSKIRKKKHLINQTILPFLRFNLNKKSNKNNKNISPKQNNNQIISIAIPEINETTLNSK